MGRVVLAALLMACLAWAGEVRTWTSQAGKTIEAELVSYSNGKVTLKTTDGRTATIDASGLSAADQMYLEGLGKAVAQPKPVTQPAPVAQPEPAAAKPGQAKPTLSDVPGVDELKAKIQRRLPWLIAIAVLNVGLAFLWGKLFFGGWAEFFECVRYKLTPDVVSMFRGEWGDDLLAEWKLGIFTFWCIGTTIAQLVLFMMYVSPHLG